MLLLLALIQTTFACPNDGYESNDTPQTAAVLGHATSWPIVDGAQTWISGPLITSTTDLDWFAFRTAVESDVTIEIDTQDLLQAALFERPAPGQPLGGPVRSAIWSPITLSMEDLPAGDYLLGIQGVVPEVCTQYEAQIAVVEDASDDDDGVSDPVDVCPDVTDPGQLDSDGDGEGNACETDDCLTVVCTDNTEDGACADTFDSMGGFIPIYRSHDLDTAHSCVERAVIALHGNSRKPWSGLGSLTTSATTHGMLESTVIIAPHFESAMIGSPDSSDCDPSLSTCNTLQHYWDVNSWKQGDDGEVWVAQGANPVSSTTVSSFEIIDEMIDHLLTSGNFPNLEEIVITGHSAGGQFTQRYAVGALVPLVHTSVDYTFLPANPSSYMLMSDAGLNPAMPPIVHPFLLGYKYGFLDRLDTPYMNVLGIQTSSDPAVNPYVDLYLDRDVTYLIGSVDDCGCNGIDGSGNVCDPDDSSLSCSLQSKAQGNSRHDRAINMLGHLDAEYGPAGHVHDLLEVPGIGHSSSGMVQCGEAPGLIFGVPLSIPAGFCPPP